MGSGPPLFWSGGRTPHFISPPSQKFCLVPHFSDQSYTTDEVVTKDTLDLLLHYLVKYLTPHGQRPSFLRHTLFLSETSISLEATNLISLLLLCPPPHPQAAVVRRTAISMSILSVCLLAYRKTHVQSSPDCLYTLPVAVARSFSDSNAIRYVLPVSWMTSHCHVIKRVDQNQR